MDLIHRRSKWLFSITKAPINVKNTFLTQQESTQVLFTTQDTFTKKKINFSYTVLVSLDVELVPTGKNKFYEGLQASNFKEVVEMAALSMVQKILIH